MELQIQKYLRSGKSVGDLHDDFGIKCNRSDDLYIFNYDQINSPKTHPIVMESRSLILQEGTWDIISQAFVRFFNYGEALSETEEFYFSDACVLEKIDGSIISVFFHNGSWRMATRGTIDGTGEVGFLDLSFGVLFRNIIENNYPNFWDQIDNYRDSCFTFELVSPESKVVKLYEKGLYLLTARYRGQDFKEWSFDNICKVASDLEVSIPKMYDLSDLDSILTQMNALGTTDEGFVCVDYTRFNKWGHHPRVKVKNPAYLSIARIKESGGSSMRALVLLVMTRETDEFLTYFPEYRKYIDKVSTAYADFVIKLNVEVDQVRNLLLKEKTDENRKEFALTVKDFSNPSFMFGLYTGVYNSVDEYICNLIKTKGSKNASKTVLKYLKVSDIVFSGE